jgi:hypothetical protein
LARRAGRLWQIVLAALADIGVLLFAVATAWLVAVFGGASLGPPQIVLGAVLGAFALAPVALACVWAWRGTPGMLLLGFCGSRAIPFSRSVWVCAVWFVSLPLFALPMALRWKGRNVFERLAGVELSSRSPHGSA